MNTTYSIMPDVNDDSGDTMPLDYAGTFAENIESREYACDVARIVSRCVKCHVFVILDDSATTCEYENVAIYRRGALVTESQYATYCDTVLFAHEHATPATPATPATYSVIPDVNDSAKCHYMSNDYAGTFASYLSECDALTMARIVSRCVASHVFVILDDASGDYVPEIHEHAIYLRGVLVTRDAYATYRDTVLFAHEHAPALPDLPERIMVALANGEEYSDAQLCALLHVAPALVDDAIHALYGAGRIACDARSDAIYVRALA